MDELIKSNLAIEIAQLSLDKATLKADCDQKQEYIQKLVKEKQEFEAILASEPDLKELFEEALIKYREAKK